MMKLNRKFDYRILLLLFIIIYFSNILFSYLLYADYSYILKTYLGIPVIPVFHDLEVILKSFEIYKIKNYNFFSSLDYTLLNHPYPRIIYIFSYLGLNGNHKYIISILIILFFFLAIFHFIKKISLKESILYGLIICSPPFMLGVERCNLDLLIFIMFYIFLLINSNKNIFNIYSYIIFIFISILKIYPVFGIIYFLRLNAKTFITILGITCLIFIGYYFFFIHDFEVLSKHASQIFIGHSYGSIVSLERIKYFLPKFYPSLNLSFSSRIVGIIVSSFIFICIYIYSSYKKSNLNYSDNIDSFRIGSIIYISSFFMGNNFYYKLIFLIFTIPQLIEWYKKSLQIKTHILFLIICIVYIHIYEYLKVYNKLFFPEFPYSKYSFIFYISNELFYWIIYGYFIRLILITIPDYWKKLIRL